MSASNDPRLDAVPDYVMGRASVLLRGERADAEQRVNGARTVVLLLLAVAAACYAPWLSRPLALVNVGVLVPMFAWSAAQHILLRWRGRSASWVSAANTGLDITAITVLLAGYGLAGAPDLAVTSPIWVAYFAILAAQPFTQSARRCAIAAAIVVCEYAVLVIGFSVSGRLPLQLGPLAALGVGGVSTTVLDEAAKLLLLAIAGGLATYATAWNERTLRRAAAALRSSEAELGALVGAMSDVIVVLDRDGRYLKIAPSGAAPRDRPSPELIGRRLHDVWPLAQADALLACIRQTLDTRRSAELEYSVERGGETVWFAATVTRLSDESVVCVAREVTARNEAAESVRSSEAKFRAVFDHAAVGIALLDPAGELVDSNPAFQRLLGYPVDEPLGPSSAGSPAEDAELAHAIVADILGGGRESGTIEKRYIRKDGKVVWASLTVSRAAEVGGGCLIGMAQDISERKALEVELTHQAFHDSLTGLANRALFRDRVAHALTRGSRDREHVAVLFLDLDNFKSVNDSFGHREGDRLLQIVAARLLNATRGCDTSARLGGDEFAVLLENVTGDAEAIVVAERITAALQIPIALEDRVVTVGASTGIARALAGDGPEELLRNADVAMYMAKSRGKGRWEIFAPAMHAAVVDRVALEADLRHALERGELHLAYQPIVELGSGHVTGFEALARWVHPERGLVMPDAFIPLAEETGLIVPLGRWVLGEACRQSARWHQDSGGAPLTIAVNISSRQLQDASLVGDVAAALAESGVAAANLVLEITESVIMEDTEAMLTRLHELRTLGVRLAIDDFGMGYSSLSYLRRFPVDILKIDKAFVQGMSRGENDVALARTIIALGDMLSMRTVAEGVEEPHQQTILRELGCGFAQGYLFAKPLSAEDCGALVRTLRERERALCLDNGAASV